MHPGHGVVGVEKKRVQGVAPVKDGMSTGREKDAFYRQLAAWDRSGV